MLLFLNYYKSKLGLVFNGDRDQDFLQHKDKTKTKTAKAATVDSKPR